MSEVTNEVKSFFKNPSIAQKFLDIAVSNKPTGWSKRSNAAYYKEDYALILKEAADIMLSTREDCVYLYSDFPRMNPNTVYLMVNQSLRYLVEKLDDENRTYSKWNEIINISKDRGIGIRISFDEHHRHRELAYVKPKPVLAREIASVWKQEVDIYLEDERMTKPLFIDKLCLTPDEIKTLRDSLRPLEGILFDITATTIKIVKTH